MADINQLNKQIAELVQLTQKLVAAQSAVTRETFDYSKTLSSANDNVEEELEQADKFRKSKTRMSEEEAREYDRYLRLLRRRHHLAEDENKIQESINKLNQQKKNNAISDADFSAEMKKHTDQLSDIRTKRTKVDADVISSESKLGASLKGFGSKINLVVGVIATLLPSLSELNAKIKSATVKSAGVIEKTSANFDLSMMDWMGTVSLYSGMAGDAFLELMASNRQLVNSMGGIKDAYKAAVPSIDEFYAMTGDMAKSTEVAMQAMSDFAKKGIRPSQAAMHQYTQDVWMLAKQTGMNVEQTQAMFDEVASDTDSITLLRAARDDEREAILANQRALIKNNIALGMTAEQAKEAAKMLNKMVAQKPLERLKQAAKIRALGAAMGLGGEAEAAAQAVTAGKRATPEQKQALENFNTAATNMADTAAQQGIGQELFTSTLLEKLDLDQYYGPGSSFSTSLGGVLAKNQDDVSKMYQQATDSIGMKVNQVIDIGSTALTSIKDGTFFLGEIRNTMEVLSKSVDAIKGFFPLDYSKLIEGLGGMFTFSMEDIFQPLESGIGKFFNQGMGKKNPEHEVTPEGKIINKKHTMAELRGAPTPEEKAIENAATVKPTSPPEVKLTPDTVGKLKNPFMSETQQVSVKPDLTKESHEENRGEKMESFFSSQLDVAMSQDAKMDEQLKKMMAGNNILATLSNGQDKLIDIAEKQLAAATMTQDQRDKLASNLRSADTRFNTAYQFAI